MTAQLTINGQPVDFQAFVASIVEATVARLSTPQTKRHEPLANALFLSKQLYSLSDTVVLEACGVANLKNATTVLSRRLRAAGMHITANYRSGTTITGAELNKYLDQYARNQKSYLLKK